MHVQHSRVTGEKLTRCLIVTAKLRHQCGYIQQVHTRWTFMVMNTLIDERQGNESREEIEKGIENSGSGKSRSRQVDNQLSDGKAYLETTELKPVRYVQSCRHCRKMSTLLACILHSVRLDPTQGYVPQHLNRCA
jgi:hypothetical protein